MPRFRFSRINMIITMLIANIKYSKLTADRMIAIVDSLRVSMRFSLVFSTYSPVGNPDPHIDSLKRISDALQALLTAQNRLIKASDFFVTNKERVEDRESWLRSRSSGF